MEIRIRTSERLLRSDDGELYLMRDVWVNDILTVQNGVAASNGTIAWTTVPEGSPFERLAPVTHEQLTTKAA